MKILVTGYRGFIGGHMLRRLEQLGHIVTTYEWGEAWPRLTGLDWVMHLGAISSTTERDVEQVMKQNFDFSRDLLDACLEAAVNFQYASSASVYGWGTDFRETAPPDPRTPYAWSKWLFERHCGTMISRARQKQMMIQGFRYFNVYGPDGEAHKGTQASPFYQFQKQARELGHIRLFENSQNLRRDFIQVTEVIDLQLKFLQVSDSGIWNIGSGTSRSFRDIAETFGCEIVEIPMPDLLKSSYQTYTCADMTKTRKTLLG
jgi:ADP-L-glycero-D-manno-heptose 6-epimerase